MQVTMIQDAFGSGGVLLAKGTTQNLADALALDFIGRGIATGDRSQPKDSISPQAAVAINGVVSPDGNLAYAAVATTTGTPGQVAKLSDGPDKGVCLVWAIPEGRTTYAWCWQIYPLASYL